MSHFYIFLLNPPFAVAEAEFFAASAGAVLIGSTLLVLGSDPGHDLGGYVALLNHVGHSREGWAGLMDVSEFEAWLDKMVAGVKIAVVLQSRSVAAGRGVEQWFAAPAEEGVDSESDKFLK